MGVFDYVRANNAKFGDLKGEQFQTKDFDDPWMEQYTINEEGRLIHDVVRYEDRSDPNAPKGSFAALRGCMHPVKIGEEDMNWHGYLEIGDLQCKFTDGTLVDIEFPKPPA